MKTKTFIIKVLKLITIILLLSTLLVLVVKKRRPVTERFQIYLETLDIQMLLFILYKFLLATYILSK